MKHTPGPWINLGNGDIVARSDNYCGGEKDIASVFLTSNDEDEANANLIAVAPELLEALTGLLLFPNNRRENNKARAAIEKATGKPNDLKNATLSNGEFTIEQIAKATGSAT